MISKTKIWHQKILLRKVFYDFLKPRFPFLLRHWKTSIWICWRHRRQTTYLKSIIISSHVSVLKTLSILKSLYDVITLKNIRDSLLSWYWTRYFLTFAFFLRYSSENLQLVVQTLSFFMSSRESLQNFVTYEYSCLNVLMIKTWNLFFSSKIYCKAKQTH